MGTLKLYAHEIGEGYLSRHHGNVYRDLLHVLGIHLPESDSYAFAEHCDLGDDTFCEPVFLMSLSQFPMSFTPEILGVTLFYYVCGAYPVVLALRDQVVRLGGTPRFLDLHRPETQPDGLSETVVATIRCFLDGAAEGGEVGVHAHWGRVRRGFATASLASSRVIESCLGFIRTGEPSPRSKMVELIARKARYARGYHAGSWVGGKSIDDWFHPDRLEPGQFLDAFARSPYVTPGNAQGSAFFRELVAFRGPMFRIFSPEELEVIAEWIDHLADDGVAPGPASATGEVPRCPQRSGGGGGSVPKLRAGKRPIRADRIKRFSQMAVGELYHHLLEIEFFPELRDYARWFASRWLRMAGRGLARGPLALPFEPYEHQDLDDWLEAQHARQVASYGGPAGEPQQTQEQLIESATQLAPMILIDGAWIQNAFKAGRSRTPVGSKLFQIYYDEVGNGDMELNHPNVYRRLLTEMGVPLPEFGTPEFGMWPCFRPEAFRVPVFWLCVSQFPERFLAETLGLNLAMELSGVGGAYRSAIDALRHHGFDPCFVELHNSIDNVSTGHTAWAIEAIKCHMDEMLARGGIELVEDHWRRVWTGYRALAPQASKLGRMWGSPRAYWED